MQAVVSDIAKKQGIKHTQSMLNIAPIKAMNNSKYLISSS